MCDLKRVCLPDEGGGHRVRILKQTDREEHTVAALARETQSLSPSSIHGAKRLFCHSGHAQMSHSSNPDLLMLRNLFIERVSKPIGLCCALWNRLNLNRGKSSQGRREVNTSTVWLFSLGWLGNISFNRVAFATLMSGTMLTLNKVAVFDIFAC